MGLIFLAVIIFFIPTEDNLDTISGRSVSILSQENIDGWHFAILSKTNGIKTKILLYKSIKEFDIHNIQKTDIIDAKTIKNNFRLSNIIVSPDSVTLNYSPRWSIRSFRHLPVYYCFSTSDTSFCD